MCANVPGQGLLAPLGSSKGLSPASAEGAILADSSIGEWVGWQSLQVR